MTYTVTDIIIYPIKSMAGISCTSAKAFGPGFEYDRRWMVVDEDNRFLTQRTCPLMALLRPSISGEQMTITYREESITFGIMDQTEEEIDTLVWDDAATTSVVSKKVDDWLSKILMQKVKLVKIKSESSRIHYNKKNALDIFVSLADGYPYLLIGDESLHHLNRNLKTKIPMNRFRPNIVVSSHKAHEEDDWTNITIGTADFKNMKPCGRCNMITIDQEKAMSDNEPLKVLNVYRKSENSVLFGTNMICTKDGIIKVGDVLIL